MKDKINNYNDASKLLLSAYIKVLRINLTDETFDEIKVVSSDIDTSAGYSTNIYQWMSGFAFSGGVYPDDVDRYLDFCNIDQLRKKFASGKDEKSFLIEEDSHRRYELFCIDWLRYVSIHAGIMCFSYILNERICS